MALSRVELRRILRKPDALPRLRLYAYPEPVPDPPERPQLRLWVIDGVGLPPRPWRIPPDARFECVALGCRGMTVAACVARQKATDAQRNESKPCRGQGSEYPHCDTRKCAQGRGLRAALDPESDVAFRGTGYLGRSIRARSDIAQQMAAARRLGLVGLLDDVPTVDSPPEGVGLGDDGDDVSEQAPSAPRNRSEAGRNTSTIRVPEGQEREPRGQAEGVPGVPGDVPHQGVTQGVPSAGEGDGGRRRRGGEDHPRVRLGSSAAVGRSDGEGRGAARGRGRT